eukprot:5775997-Pleurochrysis_carterae.AAC.1
MAGRENLPLARSLAGGAIVRASRAHDSYVPSSVDMFVSSSLGDFSEGPCAALVELQCVPKQSSELARGGDQTLGLGLTKLAAFFHEIRMGHTTRA